MHITEIEITGRGNNAYFDIPQLSKFHRVRFSGVYIKCNDAPVFTDCYFEDCSFLTPIADMIEKGTVFDFCEFKRCQGAKDGIMLKEVPRPTQ